MEKLLEYLMSLQAGPISATAELVTLLARCWDEFSTTGGGMAGHKLSGRMEDIEWEPPYLTFIIERHGPTVHGSTKAALQFWRLDFDTMKAVHSIESYRRVSPNQPKLYVNPMAEEIVGLIVTRQEDERLKWNKDGSVRIHIGKLLPEGSAVKETLAGRRRRFRKKVDELLLNAGWRNVRVSVYAPPGT